MSLCIAVKCPEGIALASDSRRCIIAGDPPQWCKVRDDSPKTIAFRAPHQYVGAMFYGDCEANGPGIAEVLGPEIEARLPEQRASVADVARRVGDVLSAQVARMAGQARLFPPRMAGIVAGFDEGDEGGRVFVVDTDVPGLVEHHAGAYGITYGGQRKDIDHLLQGLDVRLLGVLRDVSGLETLRMQVPVHAMSLKEAVVLAMFLVQTTIGVHRVISGVRGVGGAINVATVTAQDGFRWVQVSNPQPGGGWVKYEVHQLDIEVRSPADGFGAAAYTVNRQ